MFQIESQHDATLMRLLAETIFINHPATGTECLPPTGRDWALRFLPLGGELRKRGYLGQITKTTVTNPMDPIALRVLWLAGQVSTEGAGSNKMVQLVDVLASLLDGTEDQMSRFRTSVENIIRWITEAPAGRFSARN